MMELLWLQLVDFSNLRSVALDKENSRLRDWRKVSNNVHFTFRVGKCGVIVTRPAFENVLWFIHPGK